MTTGVVVVARLTAKVAGADYWRNGLSLLHAGLRTLAFGVTTQYALEPVRALHWLVIVWAIATGVYMWVIEQPQTANRRGALVIVRPEKRLVSVGGAFLF